MQSALKIKLKDGTSITINEETVSSIIPHPSKIFGIIAELRMTNGDIWMCVDPPYPSWENDALKRKD